MSPPEGHVGGHPSHEPDTNITNPDARLHSKIVEILSSTSNDCLTELGYHPSMMEKLQQYIQRIQTLEGDNARLYQDNCQLTTHIRNLSERIVYLSASPSTQSQQSSTMQERIGTLEVDRNNLIRQNQDILINASAGTSNHLLGLELDRVRTQNTRVLRELHSLQIKYAHLLGQTSPGVLSPSNSVPQISQPRIPTPSDVHQRRVSAEGVPRHHPSRLSQQHVQQQGQHYARQMQQQAQQQQVQRTLPPQQLQHAHQAYVQMRTSDVVHNPYPHHRPLSVHPPMLVGWRGSPPASAPPAFGTRSPTDSAHIPPPPVSALMNHNRPQQSSHTHSPTYPSQSGHRTAVLAPAMPFNTHSKSYPPPPLSRPTLSVDLPKEDERMTEQQDRCGRIDQSSGLKRPNSAVDGALAQDIELVKRLRTAQPPETPEDVTFDVKPEPETASPDTVVGSNPTSPVSPSPPAPLAQEKNDATSAGQAGIQNDEVAIAATPSDTVVPSNPTSPSSVTPSPAEENMVSSPSGDNLRSFKDCVHMIYEPDAEVANGYFCGRCLDRYESKMLTELPDVLVNPKFEDLLMHCMQEHPYDLGGSSP
ncbi:uncharacterized protein EDB91DRAFT_524296 [Suillus paluster]|uniref:uncharacterized protein n=1 Tax=Suillus paluster TaxID=48578 RepID=UPI001B87B83B|nr:uncharacterized protein EDB91DRAFT_524296 [Suillus paluster]KAG1752558.1 hypothetical protein EDB91DRAFT_524296 [Suillus paluster]